jgi:hypothetical protein
MRPAQAAGLGTALLRRGPWGFIMTDPVVSSRCLFQLQSLAELADLLRRQNEANSSGSAGLKIGSPRGGFTPALSTPSRRTTPYGSPSASRWIACSAGSLVDTEEGEADNPVEGCRIGAPALRIASLKGPQRITS